MRVFLWDARRIGLNGRLSEKGRINALSMKIEAMHKAAEISNSELAL
jgi:hypothetical protein